MGKAMNIGVSNVARKGKKGWIGVDGVARKIKKIWIGVGNVARLFFSGKGVLTYYGEITDLNIARYHLVGLSVGNHALFCGGSADTKAVDAYDKALVRTTQTNLTNARWTDAKGVNAGKYGLVVGGVSDATYTCISAIETFDENLVLTNNISLEVGKNYLGTTNFKGNAVICGGYDGSSRYKTVEVFDENLTKSLYEMSTAKSHVGATFNNRYAIVAGGRTKTSSSGTQATAEAFDETFTCVEIASLTESRYSPTCAHVGDFAIFAGGYDKTLVEAYDSNLTRVDVAGLLYSSYSEQATAEVEGYAIFFNATTTGATPPVSILVYDELLVQTQLTAPTDKRAYVGGAVVGDYALFAGGYDAKSSGATTYNTVDAYKLS